MHDNKIELDKIKVRHPEKINNPDSVKLSKPSWLKVKAPSSKGFFETKKIVNSHNVFTVCQEAACPNIGSCWSKKHATFMILGDTCTRACAFCNVKTGKPTQLDLFEPARVASAVAKLSLKHVVITSVDRDDLEDGGAQHFANTVLLIRKKSPIYEFLDRETIVSTIEEHFSGKQNRRLFIWSMLNLDEWLTSQGF